MQNDASLIPAVIEETLRYRSPVQSTRRYAREDTEISGTEVLKNDIVFYILDRQTGTRTYIRNRICLIQKGIIKGTWHSDTVYTSV